MQQQFREIISAIKYLLIYMQLLTDNCLCQQALPTTCLFPKEAEIINKVLRTTFISFLCMGFQGAVFYVVFGTALLHPTFI